MSQTLVVNRARPPRSGPGRWLLLLCCVVLSALIWSRPDSQMYTRDLLQAYAAPRSGARPPILLVTVAEADAGGPAADEVDRRKYAQAVHALAALGATAIGIQPTLSRPMPHDAELGEAIGRSGRTVLAHGFQGDPWLEHREMVLPVQALGEPAAALGFTAFTFDPDAVMRRMHLAFDVPPQPGAPPMLPSFPLALAQVHSRATTTSLTADELVVQPALGAPLRVPLQPAGDRTAWVLFDTSINFERISLSEIARPLAEVEVLRPRVTGKIALLVDASRGAAFPCKVGEGVTRDAAWIWAAQVEALLAGRFLADLKARLDPWFLLVFAAIALLLWTPEPRRAAGRAALLVAIWTAATAVLARRGMLLDGVGLSLITIASAILTVLGRAFTEHGRAAALERDLLERLAGLATREPGAAAGTMPSPRAPDVPAYLEPAFLVRYLPDRYDQLEFLARGGMGVVYRAHDRERGEPVALKVLDPRWRGDTNAVARFLGEIRAMQSLDHPSVVRVFDVRRSLLPYISMELVQGRSLEEVVRGGGAAAKVAEVGQRLAEALAYVHGRGIVHRDVKPSNVLLLDDGAVKLVDFGIARITDSTSMTRSGDVLGSLPYMAPEQLDGRAAGPAADVYALAVTLAALALGKPPERRGLVHVFPVEELAARGLPAPLIALLERCFAEDAAQRPADAGAFARNFRDGL